MGQVNEVFQNFQVTVPEGRRYWEDDSTGLIIKKGQIVEVNQRQFRSNELKFALIRSQILIKSGECVFAFKDHLVKVKPGNNKNITIDLNGDKNEQIPIEVKKVILQEKAKEIKKINKKPDMDDIPDLVEEV